ncbi:MAG: 3-hydroxyacyl-CoA dehydrogenase NAD-binding domain-containing protein [Candidatus Limnocylindrales bacterium]
MIVGVVGAGTMGAGIAQVCLSAGHTVRLYDASPEAVARGALRIADGLERLLARGRLAPAERDAALARLAVVPELAQVAEGAEVVIEAAVEDLAAKQAICGELDRVAAPAALLATNTSALSISAIAAAAHRPERVLGLHFFNPAPLMALVEVVAGTRTAAEAMASGEAFVAALGKQAVACTDVPGFIVNRVNRPFTLEALRMLEAGEAGIEAIDAAIVAGGYPMGPFALMDLVGIDVNFAVARSLYAAFREAARFRPSPIQERLVEAGTLGRKSGQGFYRYDPEGKAIGPAAAFASPTPAPDSERGALVADEIRAHIELAIINEAYRVAGDGVAVPPDIDLAMRLGAGHPQGPFERAAALGLRYVVTDLRRLEQRYGERFQIAAALWQVASI